MFLTSANYANYANYANIANIAEAQAQDCTEKTEYSSSTSQLQRLGSEDLTDLINILKNYISSKELAKLLGIDYSLAMKGKHSATRDFNFKVLLTTAFRKGHTIASLCQLIERKAPEANIPSECLKALRQLSTINRHNGGLFDVPCAGEIEKNNEVENASTTDPVTHEECYALASPRRRPTLTDIESHAYDSDTEVKKESLLHNNSEQVDHHSVTSEICAEVEELSLCTDNPETSNSTIDSFSNTTKARAYPPPSKASLVAPYCHTSRTDESHSNLPVPNPYSLNPVLKDNENLEQQGIAEFQNQATNNVNHESQASEEDSVNATGSRERRKTNSSVGLELFYTQEAQAQNSEEAGEEQHSENFAVQDDSSSQLPVADPTRQLVNTT